jgi:ribosomal-protein-alanine N-acetyltransferase
MSAGQRTAVKIIPVSLHNLRPADLDRLAAIDQACFAPGIAYTRAELARFIGQRNAKTWVAQAEEGIVGFVVAERPARQVAHIITIDLVSEWRRRGVGAQLMDAVESWASGLGLRLVYLETAQDNIPAQRFYRKRGYVQIETLKDYYAIGMDGWLMAKRL